MLSPLFIAYCTQGTPYEAEAAELKVTLRQMGLATYGVETVPNMGSWDANTSYKPTFIRNMMLKHEHKPLVWVDADARICKSPVLFDDLQCDFSAHWKDGIELLSGTLYFAPTQAAWNLVRAWEAECKAKPGRWDQKCLQDVIERHEVDELVIERLPAAYCQIFDTMAHNGDPVIEHTQASRRHKSKVNL